MVAISPDKTALAVDEHVTDEIKNYIDCRYIGAMEAVWRIFHFQLHDRHPAVQSLCVHLEHQQRVVFQDGQAESVVAKGEPATTLTEFFRTNSTNDPVNTTCWGPDGLEMGTWAWVAYGLCRG